MVTLKNQEANMGCCNILPLRVLIDILCVLLSYVPYAIITAFKLEPPHRGLFCDDQGIRYPHRDNTVSTNTLMFGGMAIPIVLIVFTEIAHFLAARCRDGAKAEYKIGKKRTINAILPLIYTAYGLNLFGAGVTVSATTVLKLSSGELRPHFMEVCQPALTSDLCHGSSNMSSYVTNYTCTSGREEDILQARMSFPSGHASTAAFTMVFMAVYLELRWRWRGSALLRHLVQAVGVTLAIIVGITRVTDHWHHWWDVLAGLVLGTIVALFLGYRLHSFINTSIVKQSEEETNGEKGLDMDKF